MSNKRFNWDRSAKRPRAQWGSERYYMWVLILDNVLERMVYLMGKRTLGPSVMDTSFYTPLEQIYWINRNTT